MIRAASPAVSRISADEIPGSRWFSFAYSADFDTLSLALRA